MTSRVETMILGLLSGGERHGYDLLRLMEERGFLRWTGVSKVAVYKALARLEKEGSLRSWMEKDGNMPERRVFGITAAGEERLRDAVYALCAEEEPLRMEAVIGPAFVNVLRPDEAREALERRRCFLEAQAKRIASERELLSGVVEDRYIMLLEHEMRLYRVEADWISRVIDNIGAGMDGEGRERRASPGGKRKGAARDGRGR